MSLRVAVQMDPLETINIAGDSSFALMLAAQARGHSLYHYDVKSLAYESGRLTAWAAPVSVQREAGNHFSADEHRRIDLLGFYAERHKGVDGIRGAVGFAKRSRRE